MDELDKLMSFLGLENIPQYETYRELATHRRLRKNEEFYNDDEERSRYIYFLLSGVLRGYVIEKSGRDITDCFIFRYGQAHIGFLNVGMAEFPAERAEALTETELMCFDIDMLMPRINDSPELTQLYIRKLTESYAEHWIHKNMLCRASAMERYQWFLEAYPGLIDTIPHKHIASFLDMTPVTLSRLRRSAHIKDALLE